MCGIAGIISKYAVNSEDVALLQAMVEAISHRGPDGSGIYHSDNVALGHRRLSILDLSEAGAQPMHFQDDYTIVFNGEIYNYIELREELRASGYKFNTETDTEVILIAYKVWGKNCLEKFNGMWAFAIHDKIHNTVFCARDRFGVKPFYYRENQSYFMFGSEIRQLLINQDSVANKEILVDFMLTGICDHTNQTFFKDIFKLPAAHFLTYSLTSNTYKIERYFEIKRDAEISKKDYNEAKQCYQNLLKTSVELRLRSDVPVGTCLSGGLDSSSIATIASELYKTKQSSYNFTAITAVSEQDNNNEFAYAKEVVDHSGLRWLTVQPTYTDFVNTLEDVVKTQEEPFGSPSICMQYFVMKTARENKISVLLDGQGGDETLLGYERYYAPIVLSSLRKKEIVKSLHNIIMIIRNNTNVSYVRLFAFLTITFFPLLRYWIYCYRNLYLKKRPKMPKHLKDYSSACLDEFLVQKIEIESVNLPALLRYEDKNSMRFSIETRLPFLDYRSVQTCLSFKSELKVKDGWTKWILRETMDKKMPDTIVWRKNKIGFEAPEKIWTDLHLPIMQKTISSSKILTELCDMNRLESIYAKLNIRILWRLYSIALWEKSFKVTI